MIFDFFLVALAFYLAIPGVVAYAAASYGRSFWFWFAMGVFLPIISHFWLGVLIARDIRAKKLIAMMKKEDIEYMEGEIRKLEVRDSTRRVSSN
ncbi:MAG: hypothetical protein AAGA85_17460 [Bacteroidota bacterium]